MTRLMKCGDVHRLIIVTNAISASLTYVQLWGQTSVDTRQGELDKCSEWSLEKNKRC